MLWNCISGGLQLLRKVYAPDIGAVVFSYLNPRTNPFRFDFLCPAPNQLERPGCSIFCGRCTRPCWLLSYLFSVTSTLPTEAPPPCPLYNQEPFCREQFVEVKISRHPAVPGLTDEERPASVSDDTRKRRVSITRHKGLPAETPLPNRSFTVALCSRTRPNVSHRKKANSGCG